MAVILADGFEEVEAVTVIDVLRRAEIDVLVAGLHPGPVRSARDLRVVVDVDLDALWPKTLDMVVLPGGKEGVKALRRDKRIAALLRAVAERGVAVAAIGTAPVLLAEAGLLANRRVTACPSCRQRLGAVFYEDACIVEDGPVITGRGPGAALPFALAMVARFTGNERAVALGRELFVHDAGKEREIWSQRLFDNTLQALVAALEIKDPYTQGHAKRVTDYALCIGSRLKLSEGELRDLYMGALLHDIGKIGTHEQLLNKKGNLSLEEETLVREHPLKGTLMVVGIENLSHIVPTILHHHERWDGKGYPGRLRGEQIPLHARIVAVADAFDAMSTNRTYRKALGEQSILDELKKERKKQFDPRLLDLFIQCLKETDGAPGGIASYLLNE
ncbi:MAG: DJ-1/PfpI family protein [Geobacteraceae bacterium]|nr:DJ-1/PfpI family protein [Geobacteraceae bacterium]